MPQNTHLEIVNAEIERLPEPVIESVSETDALAARAAELAGKIAWLPNTRSSRPFSDRCRVLRSQLRPLLKLISSRTLREPVSDDYRWFYDNLRLVSTEAHSTIEDLKSLPKLPHIRTSQGALVPRVAALAEDFLRGTDYEFGDQALSSYVRAFQKSTVLRMVELSALSTMLKLVLLEEIAARGSKLKRNSGESLGLGVCIRSLRDIGQTSWKDVIEPLILFDKILREDPAGAYSAMEYESRELYRLELVKVADYSDCTEVEVAKKVVVLAREAQQEVHSDPRVALRRSHVGYYLVAEGTGLLYERVGYRPPIGRRVVSWLRRHPDEFYLPGIQVLTFAILSAIVLMLTNTFTPPGLILLSMFLLFLPSSQSAVQLMNYLTTAVLRARILPKLNLSGGVCEENLTLIAVPCLLLNKEQVTRLVDDLEVRFLGNHDPNIHFALLTDLPDSTEPPQESDPLVDFCSQLVTDLNRKYTEQQTATFLMLHRHRVYNPRERVWMGWERKRGKLLDLNKLLRGQYDSFPVKIGDLSILPRIRFVITLDADTELPRGSAHRMIGAMAHPLNQAIIDPEKNIVVAGYGILQPRVGVSVQSASTSRLASLYSGETGFDIYTRAVSDVYQDLYDEGIFTGKGIYEVDTVHRVLDRRFPRNALLSHDLIEGAYARAGLASDIEIIEDYPSHYSAYNRRKHRWLRGDWQITNWLASRVPDESGHVVQNPMSLVSQWKILDNLRRSLVEPATFLLFVLGWLMLPGKPQYWTLAVTGILFVPSWFQFLFGLMRAVVENKMSTARDAWSTLLTANANVLLTLIFLAHQTLISLDAVVRTLIRRLVTRQRLLEWETAAEAEIGKQRRTPVDIYLNWMPVLALGLGTLVWLGRPKAFTAAVPILLLWAGSKLVALWLNSPPSSLRREASDKDEAFLRRAALRTWRYFAEFSSEEHNWLIPDNVQEHPASVAARFSPTNLGFLFNARQVACEFGFLTVPEFACQTLKTLATVLKLKRFHGHLFNWYDTRTLEPLPPQFVSSVDSGNLVASLWTLEQGCLDLLRRPLFEKQLADGLVDHLRALVDLRAFSPRRLKQFEAKMRKKSWLQRLLDPPDEQLLTLPTETAKSKHEDVRCFTAQSRLRLRSIRRSVQLYSPWLLPEFLPLWRDPSVKLNFAAQTLALQRLPEFIDELSSRLEAAIQNSNGSAQRGTLLTRLRTMLPEARTHVLRLIEDLYNIAQTAATLADAMDFRILLHPRRKLLSIGFDIQNAQLHSASYDLLASESRTAAFVAIAKEEVPQETWFLLGRTHTLENRRPVLLSWTGTMFEYLMPALWMRTYPNTLLERSRAAVVRVQQAYAAGKQVPWGISECAYFKTDKAGNYQYQAFGVPRLALHKPEHKTLVISPYSTFLALHVDPAGSLENLRQMSREGWFGSYGFYESADYNTARRRLWGHRYNLVRCWMAHHQGMILLSIANFLHEGVVQRWFHSNRRVQATELLLHEKPVARGRAIRDVYHTAA